MVGFKFADSESADSRQALPKSKSSILSTPLAASQAFGWYMIRIQAAQKASDLPNS